jgi:hypothetical protein
MKAGFSVQLNERFIEETRTKDFLDVAVVWISDNLCPDDVFDESLLEEWAEDNGYRRRDD